MEFNLDTGVIVLDPPSRKDQARNVLTSMESDEWGTPEWVVELVRKTLGKIDFDPASSEAFNTTVKATTFFSLEDDGLKIEWPLVDTCFMNPPYGKVGNESMQMLWINRLRSNFNAGNIKHAIALVNANLGYDWFEKTYREYPSCLFSQRLHFLNWELKDVGVSKRPSCALLFTNEPSMYQAFYRNFSPFGRVLHPRHGEPHTPIA